MNSLSLFICALSFTAVWASPAGKECDKTKCKGPLNVYKDLSCEPIYKNKGDCCPYKYDCNHLKNRSADKCHFKGHEYMIGELMREEDAELCEVNCVCRRDSSRVAAFLCASVECIYRARPGCYFAHNASQCCPSEVCPKNNEAWSNCEVDGKTYKIGAAFKPAGEPDKECHCGPGYNGENVEPFCETKVSSCGIQLHHANQIYHNCPPVFYKNQSPQKDCAHDWRCQTDEDKVIKPDGTIVAAGTEEKSDMVCNFGNLTMKVGEELSKKNPSDDVKCVCEIPPMPTCQHV